MTDTPYQTASGKLLFPISGGLGMATGLDAAAFAQTKFAASIAEAGYLVGTDGKAEAWRFEGSVETDAGVVVYGPAFDGVPLSDSAAACGGKDEAAALRALQALAARSRALEALRAGAAPDFPSPAPLSVLVAADGRVLFLPPRLFERALNVRAPADRLDAAVRWRHPDLKGDAEEAFARAALAYRILCGKDPFPQADEDEARTAMREGVFELARWARPGLAPAAASALDAALGARYLRDGSAKTARTLRAAGSSPRRAALETLDAALESLSAGGLWTEPDAAAAAALAAEQGNMERKRDGALSRERFLRRNRTKLIVAGVAAVALIMTVKSFVDAAAAKPTTKGMGVLAVARMYYAAMGDLDRDRMEACVADGAGKGDLDAATNLFVIARVRSAYEKDAVFLNAAEWVAKGSPATTAIVYGPSDLSFEGAEPAGDANSARVAVRYKFWTQESAEKPEASGVQAQAASGATPAVTTRSHARTDQLVMEKRKGSWRIVRLERSGEN